MPELPDLEAYRSFFNRRLPGIAIEAVTVLIPLVVRAPKDEFIAALIGNAFSEVERRGKFLLFSLKSGHHLAVHPMLSGRFQYCPPQEKRRAKTCFSLALANGQELRYFDERLMGKVYLVRDGDFAAVPRFEDMGPEPLSEELTEEAFRERLRRFRGQIKNVILNEALVAGIGNAYADEILFAAAIHPYRKRTELSAEDEGRLYRAIRSVLSEAAAIVSERMETEGLPVEEYRHHLRVHRRGGQPCPNCGAPITEITAGQRVTNFCRHCQR
ncbi:MAG: Fpg/Nei family DNA glycosylase [Dehalococcoidia bacterium]